MVKTYHFLMTFFLLSSVLAQDQFAPMSNEELNQEIKKLETKILAYEQECVQDLKLTYEQCVFAKNALTKNQEKLNAYIKSNQEQLKSICSQESLGAIGNLANSISEINTKVTCTEADKKYYSDTCMESLKCVLLASGPKVPGVMKFMYQNSGIDYSKFRSKDECYSFSNDCGARAILGLAKTIEELAVGIWDLAGLGVYVPGIAIMTGKTLVKKAKDRWNQFWNATNKVEDVTSDIALLASKINPKSIRDAYVTAEAWKLQMTISMWEGIKTWMSHTVYCGKWSGLPFYSDCLRPVNTKCMACADIVSGSCSLLGVLLPDLIDLFITAGGIKVAKWGPKIANKIFLNRKMIALLKKNKHLIDSSKLTRKALEIKPKIELKVSSLNKKLKEPLKAIKKEVKKLDVKVINPIAVKKLDNGSEITLLTKGQYDKLPVNTTLYDTQGNMHIKGISELKPEVSNGFLNYGVLKNPEKLASTSSRIDIRFNALEEIKDTEIAIKKELLKNNMLNEAPELGSIRLSETQKSPYALSDDENPLRLIKKEQYDKLPDGTLLEDINNQRFIKGLDDIGLNMSDNNYLLGFRQSKIVSGVGHKKKISNQASDALDKLKELKVKREQVQKELVHLKKLEKIEGKQKAYQEMDQLLDGASLKDFAKANNFEEVPIREVKGYDKLDEFGGFNDEVLVNFTPKGEKQARTIKGKIVQQYETGFDLKDANGFEHKINSRHAKINEVYVGLKPDQYIKPAPIKKSSTYKLEGLLGQLKENVINPVKSYFSKGSDDIIDINKDLRVKILTKKEFNRLPSGSKIYDVDGNLLIKGKDKFDLTTLDNKIGYGLPISKNPKELKLRKIQKSLLKAKIENNLGEIEKLSFQQNLIGREVAAARFYDERAGLKVKDYAFKNGFQEKNATRSFDDLTGNEVIIKYKPSGETAELSLKGYTRSSGKNYIDLEDAEGIIHRIHKKRDDISDIYYKNSGPKNFKDPEGRRHFASSTESIQKRISNALAKPKEKYNVLVRSIAPKLNKMERYNKLISEIKRNKNITDDIKEIKIQHLKNKMEDLNELSLREMKTFFDQMKLRTELITPKDSFSYLRILDRSQQQSPLGRFFGKMIEKYQGKDITISLADNFHISSVDNTAIVSGGFHYEGRVDLGFTQLLPMLNQSLSKTAKHELRHLIFRSKKLRNEPSLYHQDFQALGTKGLLDDGTYNSYLSAEEIYNWSTDIGEYTKRYLSKSRSLIDKDDAAYVYQVTQSARSLRSQSDGIIKLTRSNINKLQNMENLLSNNALTRRQIIKLLEDSKIGILDEGIIILDDSSRASNIVFAEKSHLELLKKCFEVRGITTCNQNDLLNIVKIAKNKQQELNKVAGVQSARASKIIREGEQNLYISKDHVYIIDDDKLKLFTKDALRLSDGVKEGFKSYAGNVNSLLPSLPIYQDISANPKKIAKFNEFMRYAKSRVDGDLNTFLEDLNEIHVTGSFRDKGLDFAKGRKMKEFLDKYPNIEKEKLLELAQKNIGILGQTSSTPPAISMKTLPNKPRAPSGYLEKTKNYLNEIWDDTKALIFDEKPAPKKLLEKNPPKETTTPPVSKTTKIDDIEPTFVKEIMKADSPFSFGASLTYIPDGYTRKIDEIDELIIKTQNAEDLALTHEGLNVSKKLTNDQLKKKAAHLANKIKADKADIVGFQEVADLKALEKMVKENLNNEYKVLAFDNDKRFHKIAYIVKKDLPFRFELHSMDNLKNGKHFVFGKDLPTLAIYSKTEKADDPLMVLSTTHNKSSRVNDLLWKEKDPLKREKAFKRSIETSERIRREQNLAIKTLKEKVKKTYGDDTAFIAMGDFNRDLRVGEEMKWFEESFYNSLDHSNQLPNNKNRGTYIVNAVNGKTGDKYQIYKQLDGIYGDNFINDNKLFKESYTSFGVDDKGKILTIKQAQKQKVDGVSDHAGVVTKLNFNSLYGLKKYPKLKELEIYQDIVGNSKAKKELIHFLNKAELKKLNITEVLDDLNDIHLTGFRRDQGLDFSKGRKMKAFLDKYPSMSKDDLLKLADRRTPILGRVERTTYKPDEILSLISPQNFNERDLISRFGEDYLFETLIMPRSIKSNLKAGYKELLEDALTGVKTQPGVFDYYLNRFVQKYDDEMMDVLLRTDISRQDRAFESLNKLKNTKSILLDEINTIRKDHKLSELEVLPYKKEFQFLDKLDDALLSSTNNKQSPFHYGKSITYKAAESTRDIDSIREVKIATYNLKDLKGDDFKRVAELARVIEKSNADVLSVQEVIDPKLLRELSKSLKDQYKVMFIDIDELGSVHKTAFLVKKDLPFDFKLHSFQNLRVNKKKIFYKDLPTLEVYQKGQVDKPLMVLSGVHLKSSRGARDIASVDNLRQTQLEVTNKIRDEILEFYGADTPYFVMGDFNQDLNKATNLSTFGKSMQNSFKADGTKNSLKLGSTQATKGKRTGNGTLDAIYGNNVVSENKLFKDTDIIYTVDYKGNAYNLDDALRKGRTGPSDHALVSTTLDFRSLYNISQRKLLPIESFEIFKDASLANHKLKALNNFLDFSYKINPSLKIHPNFLSDLNEIHMTGKTLEAGLDFSKGREMIKFLDKYSNENTRNAFRKEMLKLAQKGVEVLGHKPKMSYYSPAEAIQRITFLKSNTKALEASFGIDPLYEAFIGPRGGLKRDLKRSFQRSVLNSFKEANLNFSPRELVKMSDNLMDEYDKAILKVIDRKGFKNKDKVTQVFYTMPQIKSKYLSELNNIRVKNGLPKLERIPEGNLPEVFKIKEINGNALYPDATDIDEGLDIAKRDAFEAEIKRRKKENQISRVDEQTIIAKEHKFNSFDELKIYNDLKTDPVKLKKFNEFFDYAQTLGHRMGDQFYVDLNKIHMTGKTLDKGLDFSKGRLMVDFLEKYTPKGQKAKYKFRKKFLELAKKPYNILGLAPEKRLEDIDQYFEIAKVLEQKLNKMKNLQMTYNVFKDSKRYNPIKARAAMRQINGRLNKENDYIVEQLQKMLELNGIKTDIIIDFNQAKALKINLNEKSSNQVIEFLQKVKDKYPVDRITYGPYDNIKYESVAFYTPGQKRLDLGKEQTMALVKDILFPSTKHELRHLIIHSKKLKGELTPYSISFDASDLKKLSNNVYTEHLSTEEIYNYSTDIGTSSRKINQMLKNNNLIKLSKEVDEVEQNLVRVMQVSKTTDELTDFQIDNVSRVIKKLKEKRLSDLELMDVEEIHKISIKPHQKMIILKDYSGRQTKIPFVSEKELKLLYDYNISTSLMPGTQRQPEVLLKILENALAKLKTINIIANDRLAKADRLLTEANFITKESKEADIKKFISNTRSFSDNAKEGHKSFVGKP